MDQSIVPGSGNTINTVGVDLGTYTRNQLTQETFSFPTDSRFGISPPSGVSDWRSNFALVVVLEIDCSQAEVNWRPGVSDSSKVTFRCGGGIYKFLPASASGTEPNAFGRTSAGATQITITESDLNNYCASCSSGGNSGGSPSQNGQNYSNKEGGDPKAQFDVPATKQTQGVISFKEGASMHSRAGLSAAKDGANGEMNILTDSGGIRQFKTDRYLVDLTDTSSGYQIRYFPTTQSSTTPNSSTGFYTFTGSPESVVELTADAPSGTYLFDETHQGVTQSYLFTRDTASGVSNQWSLEKPGSAKTSYEVAAVGGDPLVVSQGDKVYDGTTLLSHVVRTQRNFNAAGFNDWKLIEEVQDPDGEAATTTYTYETAYTPGSKTYGKLLLQVNPNGSWTRYTYDSAGRETRRVESLGSSAPSSADSANRVIDSTYTTLDSAIDNFSRQSWEPRTQTETIAGQLVRREFWVRSATQMIHERATSPTASYGDSASLRTVTNYISGGTFNGLPSLTRFPDGTIETRSYLRSNNDEITTVTRGAPNTAGTAVVAGTRVVTTIERHNQIQLSRKEYDVASGLLLSSEATTPAQYDTDFRPLVVTHEDGSQVTNTYACCGLSAVTDRDGTITTYTYDAQRRRITETRDGITLKTDYDALDRAIRLTRIGTDASEIILQETDFDLFGRVVARRTPSPTGTGWAETTMVYTDYGDTVTTTRPDGSTEISVSSPDGRLVSVSGTGADPVSYSYGTYSTGQYTLETRGSETLKTYTDLAGRTVKVEHADGAFSTSHYNALGQLVRATDPDGVSTLYTYDTEGALSQTTLDRDGDHLVNPAYDTVRTTTRSAHTVSGNKVRRQTITENGVTVSVADGTANGLYQSLTSYGLVTTTSTVRTGSGGLARTVTEPDGSQVISTWLHGREIGRVRKDATGTTLATLAFAYDAHRRLSSSTETGVGTALTTYNDADLTVSTTTPAPSSGGSPLVTDYAYDQAGRVVLTTHPDASTTTQEYHPTGRLKKTYGSQTYPVEYAYDGQGRMTTMTTWRDYASSSGAAVTTWDYDGQRGWLSAKVYPAVSGLSCGTDYTYTPAGRLASRTWARSVSGSPVVTLYTYDDAGALASVDYSDSTPDVTYTYDARGRLATVSDGAGARTVVHTDSGLPLSETYAGGPLDTFIVSRTYDSLQRPSTLASQAGTIAVTSQAFAYDNASRLHTVSAGGHTATYAYHPVLQTVQTLAYANGTSTVLTSTQAHDALRRLVSVSSATSAGPVSSHVYTYDPLGRRTRAERMDGTYWDYTYDANGQVTAAGKREPASPALLWVPGQRFEYDYDDIGNRTASREGGDLFGANLRASAYTTNSLNQYTQRTVPSYVDFTGWANPAATVTVDAQGSTHATARNAGYFFKDQLYSNGSGLVADDTTIRSVLAGAGPGGSDLVDETERLVLLAQTPEAFAYDADGNLLSDGLWSYTWDGENRLVAMQSHSAVPDARKKRLEFAYDSEDRRVSKRVLDYDSGTVSYVEVDRTHFIWNGWLLLAELDGSASNAMRRSYVWGTDLSGSLEGAGAVGGLLWQTTATQAHCTAYDGNGNVSALVDSTGTVTAEYDYGPFGQVVEQYGSYASANRFRFSTKWDEAETGLYYYGFRYYNPSTGRWPSRDPINEAGGLNLYGMVGNDAINGADKLGLWRIEFARGSDHLTIEAWLASGGLGKQYDPDGSVLDPYVTSNPQGWGDGSRSPLTAPSPASTSNSIALGVFGSTNFNRWTGRTASEIQWSGELIYDVYITPENGESEVCSMAVTVDSTFFLHRDTGVSHSGSGGSRSFVTIHAGPNSGQRVGVNVNPFNSYSTIDYSTNQSGRFAASQRTKVATIFVGHAWYQYAGDSIITNAQTTVSFDVR